MGHNFGSRYARKPIKCSKDSDHSLVSKKKLEPKHRLIWLAPRAGKIGQKYVETSLLWRPTQRTPNTKLKFCFSISTRRLAESVDGLNSSLGQLAGELWRCKTLQKKWRTRGWNLNKTESSEKIFSNWCKHKIKKNFMGYSNWAFGLCHCQPEQSLSLLDSSILTIIAIARKEWKEHVHVVTVPIASWFKQWHQFRKENLPLTCKLKSTLQIYCGLTDCSGNSLVSVFSLWRLLEPRISYTFPYCILIFTTTFPWKAGICH